MEEKGGRCAGLRFLCRCVCVCRGGGEEGRRGGEEGSKYTGKCLHSIELYMYIVVSLQHQ